MVSSARARAAAASSSEASRERSVAERMQLGGERLLAAVGLAPPLDRRLQRVERERKTLAGGVDGARLGHSTDLRLGNTPWIRQP